MKKKGRGKSRRRNRRQQRRTGYTMNAAMIEKQIMIKAGDNAGAVHRVVTAGMKVLFSPETHGQFFDNINPNKPLADQMGAAAVHLMMLLYKESKQTMPGEAIIPAGTILLAKTGAFIKKTNLAPITDDDFLEAVKMLTEVIKKTFQDAIDARDNGQQPSEPQQNEPQPAGNQAQGMLNAGQTQ